MTRARISRVDVTPVAFRDPPLLNVVGVHQPWALRAIVEVHTDDGSVGLGETYADTTHLERLDAVAKAIVGADPYDLNGLRRTVAATLAGGPADNAGASFGGMLDLDAPTDTVLSPFEVACLDLQGRQLGRPVSDLLGGAVRERVPFSAYLFYKWSAHPGQDADSWGRGETPEEMVAQARRMFDDYGFRAIKLKGGVHHPGREIETIEALADAFPDHGLRLDPNGAWTVPTAIRVARALEGTLEYLEDPTPGIDGMAAVARETSLPLATNMCVIAFEHVRPAVLAGAVDIVLSDHHLWGGLRRSQLLAGIAETMGLGLSMHSNSHLGVSLAAMTHLAAATEHLSWACDTHYPWKDEDVVVPGELAFEKGSVAVPTGPGLGVELDRDELGRLHDQYLSCGFREREDTRYMQSVQPDFVPRTAHW
jgi:glucarate dehydratase